MDTRSQAGDQPPLPVQGRTCWIVGLAGAGKSTLSRAIASRLRAANRSVIQLDSDRLRPILGDRYSFARADRRAMARIYSRLCLEFARQGHDVVCTTGSMIQEQLDWNRLNLPAYREIHLRVSVETLVARHPKGLQAAARAGRIRNVMGVDLPSAEPLSPDVLISDDGNLSAEAAAEAALAALWAPEGP